MIPISPCYEYYKKMLELQERLRESENERARLVERFNSMERKSRLKHEVSINKLRMRYIQFLEEQRERDQRNHKLLRALDRIDESLALMSAKTDRLSSLRKEYDALLIRGYVNRGQTESVTVDSGVVSQNEDWKAKKDLGHFSHAAPRSYFDSRRTFYTSSASPSIPRNLYRDTNSSTAGPASSLNRTPKSFSNRNDLFLQYRQAELGDYEHNNASQLLTRKPEIPTWAGESISDDFDPVLEKEARLNLLTKELSFQLPKGTDNATIIPKLNSVPGTTLNSKEERVGSVLENELDRYIHQIRSLHDNNDSGSLEGVEQNTSGDLLNETLSDGSLYYLPVVEKEQKREIPTTLETIPTTPDDLVSKTVDESHMKDHMIHAVTHQDTGEITTMVTDGQKPLDEAMKDTRVAAINGSVSNSKTQLVALSPECTSDVRDNIKSDIAMIQKSASNFSAESIKTITPPTSINVSLHPETAQLRNGDLEFPDKCETAENIVDHVEIIDSEDVRDQLHVVDDKKLETTNNLEVWNTENSEIKESGISVNVNPNPADALPHSESDMPSRNVGDENFANKNENEGNTENAESNLSTGEIAHSNIIPDDKNDMNSEPSPIVDYEVPAESYETNQQFEQPYTQDPQDPNQIYEYNNEHYHHDPNQPYQYDPNLQYEQGADADYQYDQQDPNFIADPNAQYQDQPYIDHGNQQYGMNLGEQYHEYSGDPNQQYEPGTYVQDPNAEYDPNTLYTYPNEHQNYVSENDYEAPQDFISDQHHQEYQEQSGHYVDHSEVDGKTTLDHQTEDLSNESKDNEKCEEQNVLDSSKQNVSPVNDHTDKKRIDVINNILDSDTDSFMEKNISNTESDFDFN